jgi:hypothetical protein
MTFSGLIEEIMSTTMARLCVSFAGLDLTPKASIEGRLSAFIEKI